MIPQGKAVSIMRSLKAGSPSHAARVIARPFPALGDHRC